MNPWISGCLGLAIGMLPTVIEYTIQARRNRQPKVEPYKDERTHVKPRPSKAYVYEQSMLEQLRERIYESIKRDEWRILVDSSEHGVIEHCTKQIEPLKQSHHGLHWTWDGHYIGDFSQALIFHKVEQLKAAGSLYLWETANASNAQPIKKDVDNAPKV